MRSAGLRHGAGVRGAENGPCRRPAFRFIESLLGLAAVHWDREPTRNHPAVPQRRCGAPHLWFRLTRRSDNIRTMKSVLAVVLGWIVVNGSLSFAASRDSQWKEVDDAINKGLPKTAIEKLDPIIQGALKEKAWGEATKAITRRKIGRAH